MEDDAAVEDRKSACNDVARLILSIMIMFVLVWVIHAGHRLATEAREENGSRGSEYNYVVVMFGVVTVVFGLIYFIVGLTIVAELGVDLSTWVQTRDMETTHDQGTLHSNSFCIPFFATLHTRFFGKPEQSKRGNPSYMQGTQHDKMSTFHRCLYTLQDVPSLFSV